MTETTEEKAFFITEKTPLKARIEELEKLVNSLTQERNDLNALHNSYIEKTADQVASLTKERDELKDILKDEGSSALIWYEAMGQALEQNDKFRSQLSNRDEEIKPVIECLKDILFESLDTDSYGIDNEYIQDTGLRYGLLKRRCPTEEELNDPDWWGHEYEIKEGECAVIDITLPNLEALASLQSKEGEE